MNNDNFKIRHFEIMSFGHVKRNEFIEKWITLGQSEVLDSNDIIKEIDRLNRIIKPILLQGYVPKYPIYLLIVLKAVETNRHHALEKSSNAYYFEVLIKDALSAIEIENSETDKIYQYLTDLAREMFIKSEGALSLDEWRLFHKGHLEYYDMTEEQLSFNGIRTKLEKEKIITLGTNGYYFKYPYIYYFFVAQYLARKINDPLVRSQISEMCKDIHITKNADILMFLTHLSKDDFIKDEVLKAAQSIFKDSPYLKLDSDIELINNLCDELTPLILQDVDVREHRRRVDEDLDRLELIENREQASATEVLYNDNTDEIDNDLPSARILDFVNQINKAYKMIDIIGQILKNYYGSMSGKDKFLLCEEMFKLGFRINYAFIDDLTQHSEMIIHFISSVIIDKKLESSSERATKLARRIVYNIGGLISLSSISRIVFSVGTSDLETTFTKVNESMACNSVELAYIFIKMEYYNTFPYTEVKRMYQKNKNNKIVVQILQNMVKRYLYMYETNRSERQKISDLVGMKIDLKKQLKLKSSQSST